MFVYIYILVYLSKFILKKKTILILKKYDFLITLFYITLYITIFLVMKLLTLLLVTKS